MTALASSLGSGSGCARIDLTRRAGKSFPIHTMTHGFALHANGRVEIKQGGPRLVMAHVRAGEHDMRGRVEAVRLEAKADRLLVGCSCPARSFGMLTCKHAWAVLLEIDAKGHLGELRTALKPCVVEAADAPPKPPDEPEATGRAAKTRARVEPARHDGPRPDARSSAPSEAPSAATSSIARESSQHSCAPSSTSSHTNPERRAAKPKPEATTTRGGAKRASRSVAKGRPRPKVMASSSPCTRTKQKKTSR